MASARWIRRRGLPKPAVAACRCGCRPRRFLLRRDRQLALCSRVTLALSANTSFVGFPRLCRTVAEDGFLARPFAIAGRGLVFSVGILYLAACSGSLLLIFDGITDPLIPLFAIGAFLTFTLSQTGMAVHWRRMIRDKEAQGRHAKDQTHFWINAVGATTTGLALVIIIVAKTEGAWITLLAIPCAIALLKVIRHYYDELESQVREGPAARAEWKNAAADRSGFGGEVEQARR